MTIFGEVYVHSQLTWPPSSTRSRARNPPLERVLLGAKPRIPDINVKFAFRLSVPRVRPSPRLAFRHRGRNCLFRYPSTRHCISSSTYSLSSSSIPLSLVPYFRISSCLPTTLSPRSSCYLEISTLESLSRTPISIPIVLKSSSR